MQGSPATPCYAEIVVFAIPSDTSVFAASAFANHADRIIDPPVVILGLVSLELLLQLRQFSLLLPQHLPHVFRLPQQLGASLCFVAFTISLHFQIGRSPLTDACEGRIELHVVHRLRCCCCMATTVGVRVLRIFL